MSLNRENENKMKSKKKQSIISGSPSKFRNSFQYPSLPDIHGFIGFKNEFGEMNCFLNSALQVLWHFHSFRDLILTQNLKCELQDDHYCLVCGLKQLFTQSLQNLLQSQENIIDISLYRRHLSEVYKSVKRFGIHSADDSMEALMAILKAIHSNEIGDTSEGVNSDISNASCGRSCIAHQVIDLQVHESLICECGSKVENDWDFSSFSHPFYIYDILEETKKFHPEKLVREGIRENLAECLKYSSIIPIEGAIPEFIRSQWENAKLDICPNTENCCVNRSKNSLILRSHPIIFTIQLIWHEKNPNYLEILQILASIPLNLSLGRIYAEAHNTSHILKGMILYGGFHYVFVVKHSENNLWYKLDDENTSLLGNGSWIKAIEEIIDCKLYPVGLFYEESDQIEHEGLRDIDWIELEAKIMNKIWKRKRSELSSQKKCLTPKIYRSRESRIFLKSQSQSPCIKNSDSNMQIEQNPELWRCNCGRTNEINWQCCPSCKELKPGESGWICRDCTFKNDPYFVICQVCGSMKKELKPQSQSNSAGKPNIPWQCKICKEFNSSKCQECTHCSKKKSKIQGSSRLLANVWLCKLCGSYNTQSYCKCQFRTPQKNQCNKCGEDIAIGNFCLSCISERCQICHKTIAITDKKFCWKCKSESTGNFCLKCSYYFESSKLLCKGCVLLVWECENCNKFNWPTDEECFNCKILHKRDQNLETPISHSEESYYKELSCCFCGMKLTMGEYKNCYYCLKRTRDNHCVACNLDLTPDKYSCMMCRKTRWICKCGQKHLNSKPMCLNCNSYKISA
ncbi:unnamed protein product [Blepharisma stoltei]|uniref:Ubiquitinyl hydrolase 1 n=1 Tax=Blepharisma stoltei TaxID=1481888 RepID=A0AAU9IAX1_9CILI|nr:unnamed protein product [Blepharisma stoltei]